jgi:hypothetical protein
MRALKRVAAGFLILVTLSGCANRRWGACALAGGLIGGTIGAVGAGVGVDRIEPTPTNEEVFGGAGAGLAAGMLIGTLLGHALCDPEEDDGHAASWPPSREP